MIKTLKNILSSDREGFRVPKSVQDTIPVDTVYPDGIFRYGTRYSKSYVFSDINYQVASGQDQKEMFLSYCELINSFEAGATTKITINSRKAGRKSLSGHLTQYAGDGLDAARREYNAMLEGKAVMSSGIVQEKYITVSSHFDGIDAARSFFRRVGKETQVQFASMDSSVTELTSEQRLHVIHDFFCPGYEDMFSFDIGNCMKRGISFKDMICPSSLSYKKDYIECGDRFARVLYLREYPSFLRDSALSDLCSSGRNMMMSVDIIPVPTDEAVKEVERKLLGTETEVANWQRRQNRSHNYSAVVPYDLEQQRKESREFLDDLTARDQRMMFVLVTAVITAASMEELESETQAFLSTASKYICRFEPLNYRQLQGLDTVLPYGVRKIDSLRTMTTESAAVLMPFRAQEIIHDGGVYSGQNAISGNLIFIDRKKLLNGNGFILGTSGSGKSFFAKRDILSLRLSGECDIVIIDPEREYGGLVRALGGEVIEISGESKNHINALDLTTGYAGSDNPLALKAEFVLSLFEQCMGPGAITAREKSVIDRCTTLVFRDYIKKGFKGKAPTLKDLYEVLIEQSESEAKDVALAMEVFIKGNLDTFARKTNVNTASPLICYDIQDLGKPLRTAGMLVVLDSIFNRISENRQKGRPTYVFIDEIYLLFSNEYSSNFLFEQWKRARKHNAFYTGITQNVEDLLRSPTARTMLANSELIVMLCQGAKDRYELADLLSISDTQLSYITNADAGRGLIRCAGNIVPFEDRYPHDTELYRLMTTKPGEV